jgi:hypothetical protein
MATAKRGKSSPKPATEGRARSANAGIEKKKKLRLSKPRGKIKRPRTRADVVANAKQLLKAGDTYPKGCSEFVCAVLGIDYKVAKDIMGVGADVPGNSIGSAPDYMNVNPGDICGWLKVDAISDPQADHVTVYIGDGDAKFIDVNAPGNKPRAVKNGYGRQQQAWKAQNASKPTGRH